jgi:outer membrane biosynthesis protein TonB
MDRAEATGLGVAVAGHAALVVALALGLAVAQRPLKEDPMEVSFVEEVGPVSTAPETSEAPAPALGEELAPVDEASGATGSEPAPITAPIPEPIVPPVETGERRRPDLTRNPIVIRPAAPPRVAQNQPRRPQQQRPQPQQRQQPQAGGGQPRQRLDLAQLSRSLGAGSPQGRQGSPGGSGTARQAPAALTGAQRQQIARNISGLIRPCAQRARAPNPLAQTITVDLRVTVTREGTPTSHQLVRSSGTDATNGDYVDDVVAVAMRSVRACASRIATLPAEFYENGWRTFNYRFNFN